MILNRRTVRPFIWRPGFKLNVLLGQPMGNRSVLCSIFVTEPMLFFYEQQHLKLVTAHIAFKWTQLHPLLQTFWGYTPMEDGPLALSCTERRSNTPVSKYSVIWKWLPHSLRSTTCEYSLSLGGRHLAYLRVYWRYACKWKHATDN